jgi:hypothetical protein
MKKKKLIVSIDPYKDDTRYEDILIFYKFDENNKPIFEKWIKRKQWIRKQKLEKLEKIRKGIDE